MSQRPTDSRSTPQSDPRPALQREAFILRLWRAPVDETWRCHLIHVETGRRLACDHLGEVEGRILEWLQRGEWGKGLR